MTGSMIRQVTTLSLPFWLTMETMTQINLHCILLLYATHVCAAYKALVAFPLPARSHSNLGDGVVRNLLKAGHEVTYITTFPKVLKPHASLRKIDISSSHDLLPEDLINIEKIMKKEIDMDDLSALAAMFFNLQVALLKHENVKKLLSDPEEKFDVVIVEWMFLDLLSGISAVFNCPYIWVTSMEPNWMVLKLIDELPNPAYTSDLTSSNVAPFSFMERLEELLKMILGLGFQNFYISGSVQKEYEKLLVPIIRKRGQIVPDFEEVRYNASLILGNSHVSTGQATRLPQNYKAIGGFHIDSNTDPLPEDLKKLLDNAKQGLIYFSMGSNLRSKYMPTELKASLLKMFGKLKQTVLWKFEEDLPNRPSNVHIVQWAPQQSILAHSNCVIFITHGGLLSTTEAIHFGKPIIGIPVFGDQFNNVDRCVKRGFAKRVDLSYTMADELEETINDILSNPSYTTKVKALSFVYHDRPVPPGQELSHWVEHVVHTGGAPHLRSPALLVPWYQKWYLDLIVLVTMVLYVLKLVIKKIVAGWFLTIKPKTKKH